MILLSVTYGFSQPSAVLSSKKLVEMNVDMPDETQETDVIDKRQWQVEMAYLHNNYKEGKRSSIGQALVRYGVSSHFEMRVLVEAGRELRNYIEQTVQSTYPVALSAKLVVLKDHQNLPDIALISYLQIPFNPKNTDKKVYWSPIFIVALQHEFDEKWKLDYNTGVQQEAYSTEWAWIANTSLHYKVLDQLELFTEYFAQYQHLQNPQHNIGGGMAYQVNNYLQCFFMAGGTVNYAEANHYFNGGIAIRRP